MNTNHVGRIVSGFVMLAFTLGTVWVPGSTAGAQEAAATLAEDSPGVWMNAQSPPVQEPGAPFGLGRNGVGGFGWPEDALVTLTVANAANEILYTEARVAVAWPGGPAPTQVNFGGAAVPAILPGYQVSLAGSGLSRSLVATSLAITEFELGSDVIAGTANPRAEVGVSLCDHGDCIHHDEVADASGNWMSQWPGHPLGPGVSVHPAICEADGDCTTAMLFVLEEFILVDPVLDRIEGQAWTPSSTVVVEVHDQAGNSLIDPVTVIPEVPEWCPGCAGWFAVDLQDQFDISPGQVVIASDGKLTKETSITSLAITNVSIEEDTVSVKTGVDRRIRVSAGHPTSTGPTWRIGYTDQNGEWTADFSVANPADPEFGDVFDITSCGTSVDVEEFDEDGDSTWLTWGAEMSPLENPMFVDVTADTVRGQIFGGNVDSVLVSVLPDGSASREVVPDLDGKWIVDFSVPGPNTGENQTYNLQVSASGVTQLNEGPYCARTYEWQADIPWFEADIGEDTVAAQNWPLRVPLTAVVDNDADPGNGIECMQTYEVDVTHWIPAYDETWFTFDLPPACLTTGDYVTVSGGGFTASRRMDLLIRNVDRANDIVTGWTDPSQVSQVLVRVRPAGTADRWVAPDPSSGEWIADFSAAGPGEQPYDIDADDRVVARVSFDYTRRARFLWIEPIANHAPNILAIDVPADPVPIALGIQPTASFEDPDVDDTHTAVWSWGDDLTSDGLVAGLSVSGSHHYASPGVYTVSLTVTDAAYAFDTESFQFVVIYDPEGGFVTGGGWIDSPAGAYAADPAIAGKATFGFVSKYLKGANVPTGNTEFQFRVADLNFSSTSYDWLVVAGARAQFKGSGTINGAGEYGFMLTAVDGQVNGGVEVDKFRIKIWDWETEELVYDNQVGAEDAADPTTVLGGGSIVIHK